MKKYEFTDEILTIKMDNNKILHRIRALRDFGNVKAGELGGFIQKESNLSHSGNAWVGNNSVVCDNAKVLHDAVVRDCATIFDNARIENNAVVRDMAKVSGNSNVIDNAIIKDRAWVKDYAWAESNAFIFSDAIVNNEAVISTDAMVGDISDYAYVSGFGSTFCATTFFRLRNGKIGVQCRCFYGTLEEFREKVRETHGNNKYAKEYLMIADLMEMHFLRRGKK